MDPRLGGPGRPSSDPSRTAVADRDLAVLDDHWDVTGTPRQLEHLVKVGLRRLRVPVGDRVAVLRVGRTGLRRVGSGVLSVDADRLRAHRAPPRGCYRSRQPEADSGFGCLPLTRQRWPPPWAPTGGVV